MNVAARQVLAVWVSHSQPERGWSLVRKALLPWAVLCEVSHDTSTFNYRQKRFLLHIFLRCFHTPAFQLPPYGLLPCQTVSSQQLALMLGTKQMVNIGCGIKFKRHTLRTLLISFFHSRMADSQIRTAEKADLGDCGSAIPGSIWGTKTRKTEMLITRSSASWD